MSECPGRLLTEVRMVCVGTATEPGRATLSPALSLSLVLTLSVSIYQRGAREEERERERGGGGGEGGRKADTDRQIDREVSKSRSDRGGNSTPDSGLGVKALSVVVIFAWKRLQSRRVFIINAPWQQR